MSLTSPRGAFVAGPVCLFALFLCSLTGPTAPAWDGPPRAVIYVDDDAPHDPGPGDPTISDPAEDGSAEHPFDTFQEAIDAAVSGDEIIVRDGLYTGAGNKNIYAYEKSVYVHSEHGPARCILDQQGVGSGFWIGSNTQVEGLTIRNGETAIGCYGGSPTIRRCIITGQVNPDYDGGGIYCYVSSPSILDCAIVGNSTLDGSGAGIGILNDTTEHVTIGNCIIANNVAAAGGWGGGIDVYSDSDVTVRDCLIYGNVGEDGGGVCFRSFDAGAGFTIQQCTIVNNAASYGGGISIRVKQLGSRAISNCILWGNSASSGDPQIDLWLVGWPPPPPAQRVAYCDIQSDQPLGPDFYQIISADPSFVDPGSHDFHLSPGSPCIDAGDPDFVPGAGETDLDGQQRVSNGRVDIGADEHYPFLDCNANGSPDSEDIASGASSDCNGNQVPDECEGPDCNDNGVLDECDLAAGTSLDCNADGIPDECERDCNGNGVPDDCDLANGTSLDENGNGVPDECDYVPRVIYVDDDAPGDPGPGDPTVSDPDADGSATHPFDAIQKALNVSNSGDEIIVADGVYTGVGNTNVDFGGRNVYLHSEHGPLSCVLDLQGSGPGFRFHLHETNAARLEGFTIKNGWSEDDATGIECDLSSPIIQNCTIRDNISVRFVAVALGASNAVLRNCRVLNNDGSSSQYGGVTCGGGVTIANCLIAGNRATWAGGIACGGTPTITNCTIMGNIADYYTGGIYCYQGSPTVRNCILWGNLSASTLDVYLASGSWPDVDYCDIESQLPAAVIDGGHNLRAEPRWLDSDGHLSYESPCVNAGDPAYLPPSGETDLDGDPRVLAGRVDIGADEYNGADCNHNGVPDSEDIAGGTSTDCDANGVPDECQLGGLTDCNLNGVADLCDIFAGTSQDCNANGTPDECEPGGDQDCDGDGISDLCEILSGNPDVNANGVPDECEPQVTLYVDDDGPNDPGPGDPTISDPLEDGTAEHPFDAIQKALNAAPTGASEVVTVLVADGVYTGIGNRDLDFGGKVLTLRSENGPASCIVDCQQAGRGFYFHSGETPTSVLEGFTIQNAVGTYGGGIYCAGPSPRISRCVITDCVATSVGGGGGGIYWYSRSGYPLVVSDCQVTNNSTPSDGGGIRCAGGPFLICNCTITGNQCTDTMYGGGGVFGGYDSSVSIRDCVIGGNVCLRAHGPNNSQGGGIASVGDMLTVSHCTFTQNQVGTGGGSAIYNNYACSTVIDNSIFWDDLPLGSEIAFQFTYAAPVVSYCDIAGGLPPGAIDGGGNIDADPLFAAPAGGDFHLQSVSPCIDQGDPAFAPAPGETDIDGQPRVLHGRVDMGADEFCCLQVCGDLDCDGDVDFGDINPFVQFLSNFALWQTTYPGCPPQNGDINGDGLYPDFGDINPFVALLTGS